MNAAAGVMRTQHEEPAKPYNAAKELSALARIPDDGSCPAVLIYLQRCTDDSTLKCRMVISIGVLRDHVDNSQNNFAY